jgi:hypothetical protein
MDFEEASKAWRANKIPIRGGGFAYICEWGDGCKSPAICKGIRKPKAKLYCKDHWAEGVFRDSLKEAAEEDDA